MGAAREIIRSVDATQGVAAEVKESLKILMELAESKSRVFEESIKNDLLLGKTSDNLTVPITKIIQSKTEFRAITQNTGSDLVSNIATSLGTIFSGDGNILKGIAGLVSTGLESITGTGAGEESEIRMYSVVAEYPAIVRFDFAFWHRKIEAAAISKHLEQVFACVAYKSAVNLSKLDFNDFLALYGPVLTAAVGQNRKLLMQMIEQSKKIYEIFAPKKSAAPPLNAEDVLGLIEQQGPEKLIIARKSYPSSQGNF